MQRLAESQPAGRAGNSKAHIGRSGFRLPFQAAAMLRAFPQRIDGPTLEALLPQLYALWIVPVLT